MAGTVTGYKDSTLKQSVIETSFADELIGDQVRGCERIFDALVNQLYDKDMYIGHSKRRLTQDEFHHKWDKDVPNAEKLGRVVDTTIRDIMIKEMPNPYRKMINRNKQDLDTFESLEIHTFHKIPLVIKTISFQRFMQKYDNGERSLPKDGDACHEFGTKYFVDKCAQQTVAGEPTAFEGLGKAIEHLECIDIPDLSDQKIHEEVHWNIQIESPRLYPLDIY